MIEDRAPVQPNPKVFWPLALAGWAVMVFGVVGLLDNASRTHPDRWVVWFLGAALVHDFVVAPIVFAIGRAMAAHSGREGRHFLLAGMIASGLVVVTALPVLLGFGRNPNDPSTLPNNYLAGLITVLAAIWVAFGLAAVGSRRRRTPLSSARSENGRADRQPGSRRRG